MPVVNPGEVWIIDFGMTAKVRPALLLTGTPAGAETVRLEPNAILRLDFPDLPDTLATIDTGEKKLARLTAQLPENYSLEGRFPLCVFSTAAMVVGVTGQALRARLSALRTLSA